MKETMAIHPFRSARTVRYKAAESELLSTLNPFQLVEFFQLCHERHFQEGEFIYYRNDPGSGIYLIEEGCVALTLPPESLDDDIESGIRIRELESPDHFGELSVGNDRRRLTSARAVEPCRLFGFFQSDYITLKQREPAIALALMESLNTWGLQTLDRLTSHLEEHMGLEHASRIRYSDSPETETEDLGKPTK
ncbi:MAG: cyclic nucleotide-binding domain-containing protein [Bacteroidota bacterium]